MTERVLAVVLIVLLAAIVVRASSDQPAERPSVALCVQYEYVPAGCVRPAAQLFSVSGRGR